MNKMNSALMSLRSDKPATPCVSIYLNKLRARLPEGTPEVVVVADSFHIRPLLKSAQAITDSELAGLAGSCSLALTMGNALTDLFGVARALKDGVVKTLWVAEDVPIWGRLNRDRGIVVLHPRQLDERDGDVLDDFAEWGLDVGAKVVVLPRYQIPGQHPLLAEIERSRYETY